MRKSLCISVLLAAAATWGANNPFLPYSGVWNQDANWTYGIPYAADTNNSIISAYKTCTIATGTAAEADRVFVGANSPGTLIVNGSLYASSAFGIEVGLWNNGLGDGQLTVENGGQIGFSDSRVASVKLGGPTTTKGRLQIGSDSSSGSAYLNNLYVLNDTTGTGLSSVSVENGVLDVLSSIVVGYQAGAASNAQMNVSGPSSISTAFLKIGWNESSSGIQTSGRLTVTGSDPVFDISSSFLLANSSVLDLNFDDNGIAPISALKFWYSNGATVNITGTTNVLPGTYELVTGTTGGSIGNTLSFNISGFRDNYLAEVLESTNSGAITFSLEVKAQHTYDLGACEQQLLWAYDSTDPDRLEKQLAHIDAMAEAGATCIRLTLQTPFSTKVAHIRRCNEKGIKVLIQLSGGRAELYPVGTEKRPGSDPPGQPQWNSYCLSDLDLDRSESFLRSFFSTLVASNATIDAVEMFNEINWNAFNGDLPLVEGGLFIDENTDWDDPVFTQYRTGIEKTARLTKIVSELNDEYFGGELKIITCGMVGYYTMNFDWVSNVEGGLVSQDLTLQLMHGSHPMQTDTTNYLQYVDGIGMHIYPAAVDYNVQSAFDEIAADLDPLLTIPGAGATKPFWITECGYARSKFSNETNRFEQLTAFHDALTEYDRPKSAISTVFHFAFSKECNESHYVWNDGVFDKSADIFAAKAAENTTWDRLPFDAWQVEQFGEQANMDSVCGALVDSDGDGIANLAEYATGSDPTDSSSTPGPYISAGPIVIYTARTNDPQTVCILQHSEQLAPAPDWQTVTNAEPFGNAGDGLQYKILSPTDQTGFYRIRVEQSD